MLRGATVVGVALPTLALCGFVSTSKKRPVVWDLDNCVMENSKKPSFRSWVIPGNPGGWEMEDVEGEGHLHDFVVGRHRSDGGKPYYMQTRRWAVPTMHLLHLLGVEQHVFTSAVGWYMEESLEGMGVKHIMTSCFAREDVVVDKDFLKNFIPEFNVEHARQDRLNRWMLGLWGKDLSIMGLENAILVDDQPRYHTPQWTMGICLPRSAIGVRGQDNAMLRVAWTLLRCMVVEDHEVQDVVATQGLAPPPLPKKMRVLH